MLGYLLTRNCDILKVDESFHNRFLCRCGVYHCCVLIERERERGKDRERERGRERERERVSVSTNVMCTISTKPQAISLSKTAATKWSAKLSTHVSIYCIILTCFC